MSTRSRILVGLIGCLTVAWLVRCAFTWGPCYDEWWHVWIGEARTWAHLWRELHVETHPPLSHLGVAILSEPGDAIQWARLVAIVPAACTPPLWFAVARRFGVSVPSGLLVAAAMAGAHAFAGMGIVVRGYALAAGFMVLCLWGCAPFVTSPRSARRRDAWAGAIGAVGAVWSIYTEGIVVVALVVAVLLSLAGDAEHRRALHDALRRSWVALLLAGLGCAAAVVYWRTTDIVMMQTYMPAFMPRGDERALAFLVRGLSSLVGLFTIQSVAEMPWLAVALVVAFVGGLWWSRPNPRASRFAAVVLVVAVGQLFVAAVLHQLPFGGQLRHQYPLFPLLALGVALWLDRLHGRGRVHGVVLAVFALGATMTSIHSYETARVDEFRSTPFDVGLRPALGALGEDADTILTRRYGLIPLYVALREEGGFDWHGKVAVGGEPADEFTVRFAGRTMRAIVSLRHFAAHAAFADNLLVEAKALLEARGLPHLLVLATGQPRNGFPTEAAARDVASRLGLRIDAARPLPEGVLLRLSRAQ